MATKKEMIKTTVGEVEKAIKLSTEMTKYPLSKKELKAFMAWDKEITEIMNKVVEEWDYKGKLNKIAEDINKKYKKLNEQVELMKTKKLPKKIVEEVNKKLKEKSAENEILSNHLREEFFYYEVEVPVCVIDYPDHQPAGITMVMESSPLFNLK